MPPASPPGRRQGAASYRAASPPAPDAIVIGAGLVGLASTLALAERGMRVLLLADVRRGEASPAAGGILAPSVDPVAGAALAFAIAARDRFPAYVSALVEATGVDVPIRRDGVLHLAETEDDALLLRAETVSEHARANGAEWVDAAALARLEPALAPLPGAVMHPRDGVVNNLVLMRALKARVGAHSRVMVAAEAADALVLRDGRVDVRTRSEVVLHAPIVVLAGGVWSSRLAGLPRPLPVEPARGQMLSVAATLVNRPVIGRDGYLIPRGDGRTLLGGTLERVGYDAATTPEGLALVRSLCETLCPAVAQARTLNGWAGLRPMSPDLLPIIDREPEAPGLIYATGHSRNGVLLAPLTGEAVAQLATGQTPEFDLSPFRVGRVEREGRG